MTRRAASNTLSLLLLLIAANVTCVNADADNPSADWSVGWAWGEADSRWELDAEGYLYHWDDPYRELSIIVISAAPLFRAITTAVNFDYYFGL